MFVNKELIERIASLEDLLGYVWTGDSEYPSHEQLEKRWSIASKVDRLTEKVEKLSTEENSNKTPKFR